MTHFFATRRRGRSTHLSMRALILVTAWCAVAHAETKVVVDEHGGVHVSVHVVLPVTAVAAPAVVDIAPPSEPVRESFDRANRILFETGVAFTTASLGAEAELSVPVGGRMRLGIAGGVNQLFGEVSNDFSPETKMYDAALELRYTGRGRTHLDIGMLAGLISGTQSPYMTDTGRIAGLRLAVAHEVDRRSGVEFALEPLVIMGLSSAPAGLSMMASLRWELAL